MTDSSPSSPRPLLSGLEIVLHGLADGAALVVLLSSLAEYLKRGDHWFLIVQGGPAVLVILLSLLIVARRLRPDGWRGWEMLLSVLVGAVGAVATFVNLAVMASGAAYKGDSPDAGGMTIMVGLFLYFPSAGLLILPLALKASRLSRRLRHVLGWSVLLLVVLPFIVLTLSAG